MCNLKRSFRSSSGISPIYFVLVIPIAILLIFVIQSDNINMIDIDNWSIDKTSSIDAHILWQKSISCLTPGYTTSHGAIAVSNSQILFNYGCIGIDNNFVALNLRTGKLEWKSPGDQSFQVIAVEDGYLAVFGDSYIRKLDYEGRSIWESEKFPSRAMRAIYVRGNSIYAPFKTQTDTGVYVLSQQTGQIITTTSDKSAIVTLNTVNINQLGDNEINVEDARDGKSLWATDRPSSPYYAEFTNFEQVADVLLIYSGQDQIDAFNVYTGEKLWSLKQDYASYPLVLKGLLVLYGTDDIISALDFRTGKSIGVVKLERINTSVTHVPTTSVALGGNEDFLSIAYRTRNEIINLKLDFSINEPPLGSNH